MILCVVPNPAIDHTLILPGFTPGKVQRARSQIIAAGGKGLNVARATRTLGSAITCVGFLGGYSGRLHAWLAQAEGQDGRWVWIEGETRTCLILVDPQGGEATMVCEKGPFVSAQDWERLQAAALELASAASIACISGSLPPGSPSEALIRLVKTLLDKGPPVWIDSSGEALEAVLAAGPVGIKVNGAEVQAVLGREVRDVESAALAAAELLRMGAAGAVLTLGGSGAILVDRSGGWWARPPALKTVSAIGSGDSFFAGLLTGLEAGLSHAEALQRGVAAGAANALSPGGGRFSYGEFQSVLAATTVEALENPIT